MTIYFKTRRAQRAFAKQRQEKSLPAKLTDAGAEFKVHGCKHSRYGVTLR